MGSLLLKWPSPRNLKSNLTLHHHHHHRGHQNDNQHHQALICINTHPWARQAQPGVSVKSVGCSSSVGHSDHSEKGPHGPTTIEQSYRHSKNPLVSTIGHRHQSRSQSCAPHLDDGHRISFCCPCAHCLTDVCFPVYDVQGPWISQLFENVNPVNAKTRCVVFLVYV